MNRLLQAVAPPPDGDPLLHMDATAQYLGEEIRQAEPLTGEDWQRAALMMQDTQLRADEPMRSMLSWLDQDDDEVFAKFDRAHPDYYPLAVRYQVAEVAALLREATHAAKLGRLLMAAIACEQDLRELEAAKSSGDDH